jgi:hypothetical protein
VVVGLDIDSCESIDDCLFEFPTGEHARIGLLKLVHLLGGSALLPVVLGIPDEEGADGLPKLLVYFLHLCSIIIQAKYNINYLRLTI